MKTTGAAKLHMPVGYDLLCSFLGERPIVQPQTAHCGLERLTDDSTLLVKKFTLRRGRGDRSR